MSDSDEDLTENNVFPNENTFLRGQGPFMNNKFRRMESSIYSNAISSQNLMNGYGFNQRSIYHRREISPMSMQSVPDFSRHNYDGSYYGRGISCQRSVINGRSQSPASVGSMDSTTSAAYVAQIFKNMKFNKYDKRIINEAYNKYFRNRARRRIGKRRKLKLFLKHNRRKSGDDSGDDGSNSSISSDDNRSVRSAIPRENILRPSNRANRTEILHFRATMKESDMYKDCTENLKHCTLKNMFNGHNTVMHTIPEKANNTVIGIQREKDNNPISNIVQEKVYNGLVGMQKERFTKGFMLPSQRFNKSIVKPIANMPLNSEVCLLSERNNANNTDNENEDIFSNRTISENTECRKRTLENNDIVCPEEKRNKLCPNTSNILRDDITFKKPQMPLRRQIKAKPNFLSESINSKLSQPIAPSIGQASYLSQSHSHDKSLSQPYRKLNGFLNIRNTVHTKADNSKQVNTDSDNDAIFTPNTSESNSLKSNSTQPNVIVSNGTDDRNNNDNKIALPHKTSKASKIKKNNTKKDCQELSKQMQDKELTDEANAEILISKSLQPLVGNVEIITTIPRSKSQKKQVCTEDGNDVNTSEKPLSISEVSMKPSFIKRKLFTQKLDIAEEKNMSNDNSINSPQTRNYKSREKNKVRKLATSQSCLSRDIIGEENILDLIHKIVPADQINMTAASNQRTRKSNTENEDKWDVASVISMCNNTNESDTFTDEEIFQVNKANNKNKNQVNIKTTKATELQNIKVVIEKIPEVDYKKMESIPDVKNTDCATQRTVASRVRSFWDTDFETDVEDNIRTPLKPPANRLGQIKEKENLMHQENIPKLKDTTVNSIRNKINTSLRKFASQTTEETSSNNCKAIENTSNKITNDKNMQDNHKTVSRRRAPNNIATKYDLITFLESKELTSDTKLSEKKKTNNIKTKNGLKPLETKTVINNTTKTNPKPSNKNKVTQPTTGNTKLIQKENETETMTHGKQTQPQATTGNTKLIQKENKTDTKTHEKQTQPQATTGNTKLTQKENKTETRTKKKQTQKVKVVKSTLNDSLNSSMGEHSILTRSLRLKSKQQLLNGISLNSTDNDSKSTPKPISKTKTNTPKRNMPKKSLGSNKKQTTISVTKKSTPKRRVKEKKMELTKLNESSISTRNRSLNTSLRVKQQRNLKRTK